MTTTQLSRITPKTCTQFNLPLVSVIIPTHNRPDMLAQALDSVRAQSFTDYEIIVVSNGEDAQMVAASFKAANMAGADFYQLPTGNVSAARNYGVTKAKGFWVAFLDDDDTWLANTLSTLIQGSADLIAGDIQTFGNESKIIRQRAPYGWTYHKALVNNKWYPFVGACLIKRSVFNTVQFDTSLVLVEDADFWRRVSQHHSIEQIPAIVLNYRRGHPSASGLKDRERASLRHYFKMRRDTPPALRGDLPSPLTLCRRWVLRNLMPWFVRHPRKAWARIKGQRHA